MGIRIKIIIPNAIYFITFTIYEWQKVFTNCESIDLVYQWFHYARGKYGNKIYGYVIMPNHVHLLMRISEKSVTLPKLIQNAKRFLAYGLVRNLKNASEHAILEIFQSGAKKKGAKHKVFENRYDAKLVEDEDFFYQKLEYIHNNPCQERWELAKTPAEYKYSSASNYESGQGIFDVDMIKSD